MTPNIGALYKVNAEDQIATMLYITLHQGDVNMKGLIAIHKIESDIIFYTRLSHGDFDFMRTDLFKEIFMEVSNERK